jgi:hypothetical protein
MKEKWSKGKHGGCVVSDTPNRHTAAHAAIRDDHVDYYGGHLVAESIPKQEYVNLIAAAPDLLEALEGCLAQLERDTELLYEGMPHTEPEIIAIARTAIRKAKGES